MGVDIVAYEKAELTDPHEPHQDSCYEDDHHYAFVLDGLEHALPGLEPKRCYRVSGDSWDISQSYGNYNRYREVLCYAVLGVEPQDVWTTEGGSYDDKPFYHQINFADNEGVIGPVASAKLAKDYEECREEFIEGLPSAIEHFAGVNGLADYDRLAEYLLGKYDDYTKLFKVAADTGLVDYH